MLAISDAGTTYVKTFITGITAGQWYHLCVTVYDGTNGYYSGFVNGIPFTFFENLGSGKDTGTYRAGVQYGGGTNSGFNKGAPGLIDDVRFYKRALSDPEVEYLSTERGVEGKPQFYASQYPKESELCYRHRVILCVSAKLQVVVSLHLHMHTTAVRSSAG